MDVGLKAPSMREHKNLLQRCKSLDMPLEPMAVRKSGSVVSQCMVSCVRAMCPYAGHLEQVWGGSRLSQKGSPAGKMFHTGILGWP